MNAGIIKVSDELLLRILQFPGGEVLDVQRDKDFPHCITLLIRHHEMPEVVLEPRVVAPNYIRYSDGINSVDVRQPIEQKHIL